MAANGRKPFELTSTQVQDTCNLMAAVAIGGRITWKEISDAIGRDVQHKAPWIVAHARHKLMRDNQMVFGVERGEGLIRLSDQQIVDTGAHFVSKIRHASKRGLRQITAVSYDSLSNEAKIRHNALASVFGAVGMMATQKSVTRIESKVKESNAKLPIGRTLEAFRD